MKRGRQAKIELDWLLVNRLLQPAIQFGGAQKTEVSARYDQRDNITILRTMALQFFTIINQLACQLVLIAHVET